MEDFDFTPTNGFDSIGELEDSHLSSLGSTNDPYSSGFDSEHPVPSYEQLRNAGFSENIAHRIAEGGSHSYSQKELFHVLYECDDPVQAYDEMMAVKANAVIASTDKLINDIESSGLLGSSGQEMDSNYNDESPASEHDEDVIGSCDCRSECKYNTGKTWKYADYGYSD